jgi:hypothetical protein
MDPLSTMRGEISICGIEGKVLVPGPDLIYNVNETLGGNIRGASVRGHRRTEGEDLRPGRYTDTPNNSTPGVTQKALKENRFVDEAVKGKDRVSSPDMGRVPRVTVSDREEEGVLVEGADGKAKHVLFETILNSKSNKYRKPGSGNMLPPQITLISGSGFPSPL